MRYSWWLRWGSQCPIELGVFKVIDRAGPGAKLSPSVIAACWPSVSGWFSRHPKVYILCFWNAQWSWIGISDTLLDWAIASQGRDVQAQRLGDSSQVGRQSITSQPWRAHPSRNYMIVQWIFFCFLPWWIRGFIKALTMDGPKTPA